MSRDLNIQFVAEVRKRQRKHRKQLMLKALGAALLIGISLVLAYWCQYYGLTSARGLMIVGLPVAIAFFIFWCHHTHRPIPLLKFFQRLTQNKPRHVIGLIVLALLFTYQANPDMIDVPVGDVYARLVYAPSPQPLSSNWPWANNLEPHPAIKTMTPEQEVSLKSVGRYIEWQVPDPALRVKAIHDYVARRLSYDQAVLETGKRPSQEARAVFASGKAVCEGYARLFVAIARAAGLDAVYLTGKVRRDLAPVDVIPKMMRVSHPRYDWTLHAWNAVKVQGHWYLVDTTWDDGDTYDASYLMLPPEAMIASHLPKLPSWQLLDSPVNRQIFEQAPILTPQFFAENLQLISPKTYRTKVSQTATIDIQAPIDYEGHLLAYSISQQQESNFSIFDWFQEEPVTRQCQSQPSADHQTRISCPLSVAGNYQVFLFSEGNDDWTPTPLGQLNFQAS